MGLAPFLYLSQCSAGQVEEQHYAALSDLQRVVFKHFKNLKVLD